MNVVYFGNRIRVTTPTIGVGTLTLGAAVSDMQPFRGNIPSGSQVSYTIEDGPFAWEVGYGIYTAGTGANVDTLTRATVENSSSDGNRVDLSGQAIVFITPIASWLNGLASVETPPPASTALPLMDGTAASGSGLPYSREDHVHPTDASLYPMSNPAGYVDASAAAAAAPVQSVAGRTGVVALSHTDITDWTTELSTYAPLNSPAFTGQPFAPTPPSGDSSALIATTAFVTGAIPAPSNVLPLMDGTATIGTSTSYARQGHIHPSDTSRLALSGGTMTGPLTLAADPASSMQPVTLQYLQNHTISGNQTITLSGDVTGSGTTAIATTLSNTTVVAGSYTSTNLTVDAHGRITAASNGTGGGGTVTSITAGTGLTGGAITTAGTIALANTAVVAGPYTNLNATIDAQGRITSAANGTGGGASITVGDTPPVSPAPGALWWDSVGGNLYLWYVDPDSSEWVIANTGGSGGATITISDTPPGSPTAGALWFDSVGAQTYIWYNDGTSSQWTPVNAPPPTSSTAFLPLAGGTMAGPIVLANDPTAALQAATKQYVDAGITTDAALSANNTGRNLIHNSVYTVAQRGAGPWTASGYTLDRWSLVNSGDTDSVTQLSLVAGDRSAIGDEAAEYALQNVFTGTSGATSASFVQHPIEDIFRLSGKTVTLSFWAKAASGTPKIGLNLFRSYGTGGSPSASEWLFATGNAVTISTTWARYSTTFAVPTSTGKAIGTAGHYTAPAFFYSSGANNNAVAGNIGVQSGTVQLWGIQLEIGSVVTPLAKRDPADDLAICQRFFWTGHVWGGGNGGGSTVGFTVSLPVTMRVSPTLATISNNDTGVSSAGGGTLGPSAVNVTGVASGGYFIDRVISATADL